MTNIAAGIVLYNPDVDRLRANVERIMPQVPMVVLVDNASSNNESVEQLYRNEPRIVFIKNHENLGIAAALNQIMSYGMNHGFAWMLTLDQDSVCSDDMIQCYSPYLDEEKIAILAPRIIDRNAKLRQYEENPTKQIKRCITSGSLTRVDVWKAVHGYDESMFIDYVDFDFCCSVIRNGYQILQINNAVLTHELGHAQTLFSFNGKTYYTYNHSPLRTYYYVRNVIYYLRKHKGFTDKKEEIIAVIKWVCIKLIFEKSKIKKIKAVVKGIHDGRRMKING